MIRKNFTFTKFILLTFLASLVSSLAFALANNDNTAAALLLAVGDSSFVTSTDNGVTWAVAGRAPRVLNRVAKNTTQWLAVGDNGLVLTSPDGSIWTQRSVGNTSYAFHDTTWLQNLWVVVGRSTVGSAIFTSSDGGVNWSAHVSGSGFQINAIASNGTQLVAVGDNGMVWTNTPPSTVWSQSSNGVSVQNLYGITWSNGQWIAVGNVNTVITSLDGLRWTVRESQLTRSLSSVASNGSQAVVVGQYGSVAFSIDKGNTWLPKISHIDKTLYDVAWDGTQWVAVGDGAVITSVNGSDWKIATTVPNVKLTGIAPKAR